MQSFQKITLLCVALFIISYENVNGHPMPNDTLQIWPRELVLSASDTKRVDDKRSLKWEVNPDSEGGMDHFREIDPLESGLLNEDDSSNSGKVHVVEKRILDSHYLGDETKDPVFTDF